MRGRRRRRRRVLVVGCRGRAMVGWLWWRWWCLPLGGRCREGVPPGLVVVSLLRRWVAEVWAPMPPSLGLSMSRWHRCFVSDRDGLIRGRGRRIRRGRRGADCAMGKRDGSWKVVVVSWSQKTLVASARSIQGGQPGVACATVTAAPPWTRPLIRSPNFPTKSPNRSRRWVLRLRPSSISCL